MHSLPLALTPFVGLLIATLAFASSRIRHETIGAADYYKFPVYLGYMMMGVTVFATWTAFIPWKDNWTMPWVFGLIACVFSYAAAYFLRYRVIVTADCLTVGAFSKRQIPMANIFDTDIVEGRSRQFIIFAREDLRIQISGMIGDLDGLIDSVRFNMVTHGKQLDSPEKLRDRASRSRDAYIYLIIVFGLLATILYLGHSMGMKIKW
jgi:hypothetical protein